MSSPVVLDTDDLDVLPVGTTFMDVTGNPVVKVGPGIYACYCDLGAGPKWHYFTPTEMNESPGGWFPMKVDEFGEWVVAS